MKLLNCQLFKEAKRYIPAGVNSPVRSFAAVGGAPIFIKKADGPYLFDEEEKKYIDYCLSWGALILGHASPPVVSSIREAAAKGTSYGAATKLEIDLAKLITQALPSIEKVRLTNSGTEAVMAAVRLARAFTGKNKIIKFEGSYHGHSDSLLVSSGSGQTTFNIPASLGVPREFIKHTIVVPYNNLEILKKTMRKYQRDLAGIIVEPLMANCGVILPQGGFLNSLRSLCDKYNALLIFDEVISGFRLSYGGAQELFKVRADLTCLGKIIGGGLAAGAFGGRGDIMRLLAPEGGVYQAGTLSGNPLAVSAGIATLKFLKKRNPYRILREKTERLCRGIEYRARVYNVSVKVNYLSSLFSIFFTKRMPENYAQAKTQNKRVFRRFFHLLLKEGIYFSPSPFEANFLSFSHKDKDIDFTLKKVENVFKNLRR